MKNNYVDIEKIHRKIRESDFVEISMKDYNNTHSIEDVILKTKNLVEFGCNVIFNTNRDIDILV